MSYVSQFDAFRTGYRDSQRIIRRGFEPNHISPRTASEMRPKTTAGISNIDAYLNGWEDGMRGDPSRLSAIADIEAQGIRL